MSEEMTKQQMPFNGSMYEKEKKMYIAYQLEDSIP